MTVPARRSSLRSLLRVFLRPLEDILRLLEARQHRRRDGLGLAVIVDVDVEPVHHVEMRIAEELLQRGAAHVLAHLGMKERAVVRIERELARAAAGPAAAPCGSAGLWPAGGFSTSVSRASSFSRDQRESKRLRLVVPTVLASVRGCSRRRHLSSLSATEADALVLVARIAAFLLRLRLVVRSANSAIQEHEIDGQRYPVHGLLRRPSSARLR